MLRLFNSSQIDGTIYVSPPLNGINVVNKETDIGFNGIVDSMNVLNVNGKLSVRSGLYRVVGPIPFSQQEAGEPTGVFSFYTPDGTWYMALRTVKKMFKMVSPSEGWIDITPQNWTTTSTYHDFCDFAIFDMGDGTATGVKVVMTNGVDPVVWWSGNSQTATIISQAPIGKTTCVAANRLVMANLSSGTVRNERAISVSPPLDPTGTWSEYVILADTPGEIVCIRPMGNLAFVVYKTDAVYIAEAGVDVPFTYSLKASGISGPVSKYAVVSDPNGVHYYLGNNGGIYRFDGANVTDIGGDNVRVFLRNRLDQSNLEQCFGFYDSRFSNLYFFIKTTSSKYPREAIVFSLSNGTLWYLKYRNDLFCGMFSAYPDNILIGELVNRIRDYDVTIGSLAGHKTSLILVSNRGEVFIDGGYFDMEYLGELTIEHPIQWYLETGLDDLSRHSDFFANPYVRNINKLLVWSETFFEPSVGVGAGDMDPNDEFNGIVNLNVGISYGGEQPKWEGVRKITSLYPRFRLGHRMSGRYFKLKLSGSAAGGSVWHYSLMCFGGLNEWGTKTRG